MIELTSHGRVSTKIVPRGRRSGKRGQVVANSTGGGADYRLPHPSVRSNQAAGGSPSGRSGKHRTGLAGALSQAGGALGIAGAIEVEASPWMEDNLWVLEVEEKDTLMVGTIGNLQPEKPEFKEYLGRYRKNRLFLGIRYGNLWGYSLVNQVANPAFIEGLKLLQEADLTMDTANPRPDLMEAILRVTTRSPHCGSYSITCPR